VPTTEPYSPDPALGQALRAIRDESGRSQEHVGFNAGVTAGTIGRMELARSKPDWGSVRRVADALGVSLVDLAAEVERIEGKRR
jgi:transcriptional regulator with XRE-family HTH domain